MDSTWYRSIYFNLRDFSREHTNPQINTVKEEEPNTTNIDINKTEDNIVDDILSAEDDYMAMSRQNEILNVYNPNESGNNDNLMQIEFLKDMNQLHTLDDELFYNDIDFDTFHPSHIFNANESDYNIDRNTEIMFDFADGSKSIDQDIMNALHHVKPEYLPDELLNVPEAATEENNQLSVNECATIFEKDVDLEASTNLAANLNQLIGENSVQYIFTEDDDTFIISLNSEIDAEQLTDMLNIGVELVDENNEDFVSIASESDTTEGPLSESEPIVVRIQKPAVQIRSDKDKVLVDKETVKKKKQQKLYVCRKCNKTFKKGDNYRSHVGRYRFYI